MKLSLVSVEQFVRYEITKGDTKEPGEETWFIMTNLPGNIQLTVGNLYSLRNWIEYGFKQAKNELGAR